MILKRGDNNQTVITLQNMLGITPTTSNFGPKTEQAVMEFQRKHNMNVTGIVDKVVWDKMVESTVGNNVVNVKTLNISVLQKELPQSVYNELPLVIDTFGINTPLRLAHFLAQCSHESGGFKILVESTNYTANRMAEIWPKRFSINPDVRPFLPNKLAISLHGKPELLANTVYANRIGNGGIDSGDGWNYRGRGYIQLTGRANYTEFNRFVSDDIVSNPELVATKYPLLSAGWFFHKKDINSISDMGSDIKTIRSVSIKVNGGVIGLNHRMSEFNKFYKLLT
jgi:putative chitinase